MKGQFRVINSQQSLDAAIADLRKQWEEHKWLQLQVSNKKQRSQLQNNALHLWCQLVALKLNESSFDVRHVLQVSKRMEIPWTGDSVKEFLWRPTQKAYIGKASTTRATTADYPAIFDALNKALIERFDIHVPWPSKEGKAANE